MDWSESDLRKIWESARKIAGYDPTMFRKDACGAWIRWDKYGENTLYGWEVDHVFPKSMGGDDNLRNLRPMQWQNNLSKSDDYPSYVSAITAEGETNILKTHPCKVNTTLREVLRKIYPNA